MQNFEKVVCPLRRSRNGWQIKIEAHLCKWRPRTVEVSLVVLGLRVELVEFVKSIHLYSWSRRNSLLDDNPQLTLLIQLLYSSTSETAEKMPQESQRPSHIIFSSKTRSIWKCLLSFPRIHFLPPSNLLFLSPFGISFKDIWNFRGAGLFMAFLHIGNFKVTVLYFFPVINQNHTDNLESCY